MVVRTFPTGTRRSCCARRTRVSFTDDIDGTPRKEYLHQRVRKAHLGPVDGTIARRLDQREDIVVARVNGDALQRGLRSTTSQSALLSFSFPFSICTFAHIHRADVPLVREGPERVMGDRRGEKRTLRTSSVDAMVCLGYFLGSRRSVTLGGVTAGAAAAAATAATRKGRSEGRAGERFSAGVAYVPSRKKDEGISRA